jgi:hypothetical protein
MPDWNAEGVGHLVMMVLEPGRFDGAVVERQPAVRSQADAHGRGIGQ